ncbi:MAG: nitroreductase family protein [Sedimentisphaerales bacterium]|nr:nitroreductase family protein [Sedimentisphaerales bacterium]
MGVFETIKKRYSCRAYLDKPVKQEKLDQILEAARQAPSAKNLQDWRLVVVTDKKIKQQAADCTNHPHAFGRAGVMIAACSVCNETMRCGQAIAPIDVAIALEHIALMATELGLATCWIGSFDAQQVRQVLGIPKDVAIIELMALGYPEEGKRQTTREPIGSIVCYDKWKF